MKRVMVVVCIIMVFAAVAVACTAAPVDSSASSAAEASVELTESPSASVTPSESPSASPSPTQTPEAEATLEDYRAWTSEEWNAADEETTNEISKLLLIRVGDAVLPEGTLEMSFSDMMLLAESDAEIAAELNEYIVQYTEMIGLALESEPEATFGDFLDAMDAMAADMQNAVASSMDTEE